MFIFSRKTPTGVVGNDERTWPATLTDTQANYTLTADTTFAGAYELDLQTRDDPPRELRRHRNVRSRDRFPPARTNLGGVVIVKGSTTFASRTIPDSGRDQTIQIDGMVASGQLGISVVGIGQFFRAPAGPALVVAAPMASSVYAFRGQAPTAVLTTASADDSVVGTPTTDQYGINVGFLGALGGSPGRAHDGFDDG